jgi:hypothetical protein
MASFNKVFVAPAWGDKHPMWTIERASHLEAVAFNHVMLVLDKRLNLNLFHQVGNEDDPGYHAWEPWSDISAARMTAMLAEINASVAQTLRGLES